MPPWESSFAPLFALLVVGLFALILRWACARGTSVVERPSHSGHADEYGLLVPIAAPSTYVEGELQRLTLEARGVKATLAMTNDGPRVMVFPDDEAKARSLLTG